MQAPPISQDQLGQMLQWLDDIPFSRPKKNLARDFSDAVLLAQIAKQYQPNLVQLHNYPSTNSLASKYLNWKTLNQKVFKKIGFQICKTDIENIINLTPGTIQKVLFFVYMKFRELSINQITLGGSPLKIKTTKNDQTKNLSGQLEEKDEIIKQLRDTVQLLQAKMKKMQQICRLKDAKIDSLLKKFEEKFPID